VVACQENNGRSSYLPAWWRDLMDSLQTLRLLLHCLLTMPSSGLCKLTRFFKANLGSVPWRRWQAHAFPYNGSSSRCPHWSSGEASSCEDKLTSIVRIGCKDMFPNRPSGGKSVGLQGYRQEGNVQLCQSRRPQKVRRPEANLLTKNGQSLGMQYVAIGYFAVL
jgi:hypothetical protein